MKRLNQPRLAAHLREGEILPGNWIVEGIKSVTGNNNRLYLSRESSLIIHLREGGHASPQDTHQGRGTSLPTSPHGRSAALPGALPGSLPASRKGGLAVGAGAEEGVSGWAWVAAGYPRIWWRAAGSCALRRVVHKQIPPAEADRHPDGGKSGRQGARELFLQVDETVIDHSAGVDGRPSRTSWEGRPFQNQTLFLGARRQPDRGASVRQSGVAFSLSQERRSASMLLATSRHSWGAGADNTLPAPTLRGEEELQQGDEPCRYLFQRWQR